MTTTWIHQLTSDSAAAAPGSKPASQPAIGIEMGRSGACAPPAAAPKACVPKCVTISAPIAPRIRAASRLIGIRRGTKTMRRNTAKADHEQHHQAGHVDDGIQGRSQALAQQQPPSEKAGNSPWISSSTVPMVMTMKPQKMKKWYLLPMAVTRPEARARRDLHLFDHLLLAEKIVQHRAQPLAHPVGTRLGPTGQDHPREAAHGPGERPHGEDKECREHQPLENHGQGNRYHEPAARSKPAQPAPCRMEPARLILPPCHSTESSSSCSPVQNVGESSTCARTRAPSSVRAASSPIWWSTRYPISSSKRRNRLGEPPGAAWRKNAGILPPALTVVRPRL